ncbi:hypothetical protein DL96DRAFT_1806571 [Flagelloscypha sp. PMI_526]|nr:hypothetical protein DL96DRAFT_1806571 [Flagelloscypha sp. PMI_526]
MLLKYPGDDIDDEIGRHIQALINLRTLRNERRSLIHQLPPDILIEIFLIYRARILKESFDFTSSYSMSLSVSIPEMSKTYDPLLHHPIPFVGLSYVCSLWRKIALQCASLWTHLSLDNIQWTKELLIRSKSATLVIWPRRTGGQYRAQVSMEDPLLPSLHAAIAESDRIGVLWLNLDIGKELATKITDALINRPLPALHTVYLFGSAYSRWYSGFVMPFAAHIFQYLLPQLRDLTVLDGKVLTIKTTMLSSTTLTHLQLVGMGSDFGSIQKPRAQTFLSSLENLPSLRVLSLVNILDTNAMDNPSSPLVLRSLEVLTVYHTEFSMRLMSTFLDALDLPSCSQLTVGCSGSTNSVDEVHNLLTSISSCRFGLAGRNNGKGRAFSGASPYRSFLVASKRNILTLAFSQSGKNVQPSPESRRRPSSRPYSYKFQWHPSLELTHSDLRVDILSFPPSADEQILHSAILPFIDSLSPSLEHVYLFGRRNLHFHKSGLTPWLSVFENSSTLRAIEVDVPPPFVGSFVSELRPSGRDGEAVESGDVINTLKTQPFSTLETLTLWRLQFSIFGRFSPRVATESLEEWRNLMPLDKEDFSPPSSPSEHHSQTVLEEEMYEPRSRADPGSSPSIRYDGEDFSWGGGEGRNNNWEYVAARNSLPSVSTSDSSSIDTAPPSISPSRDSHLTSTSSFESDDFVSMLRARRDGNTPLRRLEFKECFNASEDVFLPFYEFVEDVWWDGDVPSRRASIIYSSSTSSYTSDSD